MRHRKNKRKIKGKATTGRENLVYRNLAASLLVNEKVKTTTKKARLVQPLVEKIITISRQSDLSTKRRLHNMLRSKEAEKKVLTELGKKYKDRKGGYTRILKLGCRQGDGAEVVQIELV